MLNLDDVASMALALPDATEIERHGNRAWAVGGKVFAWERPFSKADVKRYGDAPVPEGEIVAVGLDDLAEKEAVLAQGDPAVFTIPHFDGYAAVLIQLKLAKRRPVRELLLDGWRSAAPPDLAH